MPMGIHLGSYFFTMYNFITACFHFNTSLFWYPAFQIPEAPDELRFAWNICSGMLPTFYLSHTLRHMLLQPAGRLSP